MTDLIARFAKLFRGNVRSYGEYNPMTRKMQTIKDDIGPTYDTFKHHLTGVMGAGIVPIMDSGDCWFGAIDIDAHGDAPDIDLVELDHIIREKDLPLTVCRSKSGGAHLYLFGSEPLPARVLRAALAKWAERLGYPGVEVFPKQDRLAVDHEGAQQYGNWINLCWFDADSPECLRYAVEGGRRITLEHFLDIAESRRVSAAMLVERSADEHSEAPPCIQRMISDGVGHGQRNEALFNLCVYLKQAYPETWREKAFDLNARVFDDPLAHAEAKKAIASVARKDYRYRCKEEPCRSLCKSHLCVTRKFGITPEEKGEMDMGAYPEFGPLEKINTEPPRWYLYVDGVRIPLTTMDMMDYKSIRVAVADHMTRLIPPMKNERWQTILHNLMTSTVEYDAPEEASAKGFLKARLSEFLHRADLDSDGTNKKDREHLTHGVPVVQLHESSGDRCVFFRAQDFIDFLKKSRSEEMKGPALWLAMKSMGVEHVRMRVARSVMSVWYVPISFVDRFEYSEPNIEVEL